MIDFLVNYWKARPDLRLGQIIGNASARVQREEGEVSIDPYYVEDDELLEAMKEVAKKF